MIQRKLVCAALLLAWATSPAFGLGLGSLDLQSALNQQFVADIELTNTQGLEIEEILPRLAAQQDFDRVGIERNYVLMDLRFKVVQTEDRVKILRVTSTRPITEPFLNFLVEVLWPNGRILREYTVLLDPPVFTDEGVAPLRVTETSPSQAEPAEPSEPFGGAAADSSADPTTYPIAYPTTDSDSAEMEEVREPGYGMTGAGDTLWSIASRMRPSNRVSVDQTMLALQRANPDAFINNNINLLKAGYVLRIPDEAEIQRESQAEALRRVRQQNDEFADYSIGIPVAQLDAAGRQPTVRPAESSEDDSGELKVLAWEEDEEIGSSAGSAGDADADAETATNSGSSPVETGLAVAREDLDRAQRANDELNIRMNDLANQVETLSELIKLKDDQLAALRAEVERIQLAESSRPVNKPTPTNSSTGLLSNPYVFGSLGLLLVAAIAGGLIVRKRRQSRAILADELAHAQLHSASSGVEKRQDKVAAVESAAQVEEFEDDTSPQTSDVMGEVEIYIAYGRFQHAISFLQKAIAAEPDRADIRVKLLEVYVQTEDVDAFNEAFDELCQLGDEDAIKQGRTLQAKLPGAVALSADSVAIEAAMVGGAASLAGAQANEDELSFDLDDLDSETDDTVFDFQGADDLELDVAGEAAPFEQAADQPASELSDDLDLDLDLDLDGESLDQPLASAPGQDGAVELGDDLSFSLDESALDDSDLKGGLDRLATAESVDTEDTLSFDLDDELDLELDEDFELEFDEDMESKLNLARAYVDMGDAESARRTLEEVIAAGSDAEIREARALLEQVG